MRVVSRRDPPATCVGRRGASAAPARAFAARRGRRGAHPRVRGGLDNIGHETGRQGLRDATQQRGKYGHLDDVHDVGHHDHDGCAVPPAADTGTSTGCRTGGHAHDAAAHASPSTPAAAAVTTTDTTDELRLADLPLDASPRLRRRGHGGRPLRAAAARPRASRPCACAELVGARPAPARP